MSYSGGDQARVGGPMAFNAFLNLAAPAQPWPALGGTLRLGAACGIGTACPRGYPPPRMQFHGLDGGMIGL